MCCLWKTTLLDFRLSLVFKDCTLYTAPVAYTHGCPTPDPERIPVLAPLELKGGGGGRQTTCYMSVLKWAREKNNMQTRSLIISHV